MNADYSTLVHQIADVVSEFQKQATGHAPKRGESLAANGHRTKTFYVPRDIADEPWLKVAASAGYNTAWATSDAAALRPVLSAIIRRAPRERQQQLDADAKLVPVAP